MGPSSRLDDAISSNEYVPGLALIDSTRTSPLLTSMPSKVTRAGTTHGPPRGPQFGAILYMYGDAMHR
jgi:hypothetical protein